jgi:hypothetical protein
MLATMAEALVFVYIGMALPMLASKEMAAAWPLCMFTVLGE